MSNFVKYNIVILAVSITTLIMISCGMDSQVVQTAPQSSVNSDSSDSSTSTTSTTGEYTAISIENSQSVGINTNKEGTSVSALLLSALASHAGTFTEAIISAAKNLAAKSKDSEQTTSSVGGSKVTTRNTTTSRSAITSEEIEKLREENWKQTEEKVWKRINEYEKSTGKEKQTNNAFIVPNKYAYVGPLDADGSMHVLRFTPARSINNCKGQLDCGTPYTQAGAEETNCFGAVPDKNNKLQIVTICK